MVRLLTSAILAAILVLSPLADRPALAQSDTAMIQSTLYFGLVNKDGGVSEQEWSSFLADEVARRFPDGLTVVSAYGQGSSTKAYGTPMNGQTARMLIIVHPRSPEAADKLAELKTIYKERFPETGVFHTRQAVEIVAD